MRASGYYAIAIALFVATIPMYRYIFERSRSVGEPAPVYVASGASGHDALNLALPDWQAKPLLPGELCEGGVVVLVNGSTYTQARSQDGHSVLCSGRYTLR